jgi:hypothetical protein
VIAHLTSELEIRKLNPLRIFAMADVHRSEMVSFNAILACLAKIIPDLSQQFLEELPRAFEIVNLDEKLSRTDFDLLFENTSSFKLPGHSKKKKKTATHEENLTTIKLLAEACKADNVDFSQVFDESEVNFSGMAKVSILKDNFKRYIV